MTRNQTVLGEDLLRHFEIRIHKYSWVQNLVHWIVNDPSPFCLNEVLRPLFQVTALSSTISLHENFMHNFKLLHRTSTLIDMPISFICPE